MNVAIYRIHYGFETIYESIASIEGWADKIIIIVSRVPWFTEKTILYLGKETEIIHPENIDENIKLLKNQKTEIVFEEFSTPKNQWGYLVNKYSSEWVLTLEPDMVFPFIPEPVSNITAWRQIEFWKNKNWRIPQRKRVGPVLYYKPQNVQTNFNNLPLNYSHAVSEKLTHNVGFCFSDKLMLYKHLLSIGFSTEIGDTPPNERWYIDKWLNWTPETVNLEISKGYEYKILKAINFRDT